MPRHFSKIVAFFALIGALGLSAVSASALEKPGEELTQVGVSPVLGTQIDSNIVLTSSEGVRTKFGDLLSPGRPIVLVPAYYNCPRLCGLLLHGVLKTLNSLSLKMSDEYKVATVSFDSTEKVGVADETAKEYRTAFKDAVAATSGWSFFVGDDQNVSSLMNQIGFRYRRDGDEFAHTAAIIVLTPEGKISQYFTGIEFSPFDLKLALIEASKGEIGTPMDHLLLFCFRFDETKGKYTWAAVNLMRAGAVATVLLLGGLIVTLLLRARGRRATA